MSSKNYNFTKYRIHTLVLSFVLSILIVISFLTKGLNLGIDFQGGVVLELASKEPALTQSVKSFFEQKDLKFNLHGNTTNSVVIQVSKDNKCADGCVDMLKADILSSIPTVSIIRAEYVGPKASRYLINNSIHAFILAMLMMVVYVVIRFNWRYSLAAITALIHDVFFTVGFFVFFQYEFNLTSIAAILTIIGYSINDSVVIFDRIRENINNANATLTEVLIDKSINETLSRTIMTSLTTIAACGALWMFGGEGLESFSAAVTCGIAFGTYSSIFIASNVLLFFKKHDGV